MANQQAEDRLYRGSKIQWVDTGWYKNSYGVYRKYQCLDDSDPFALEGLVYIREVETERFSSLG